MTTKNLADSITFEPALVALINEAQRSANATGKTEIVYAENFDEGLLFAYSPENVILPESAILICRAVASSALPGDDPDETSAAIDLQDSRDDIRQSAVLFIKQYKPGEPAKLDEMLCEFAMREIAEFCGFGIETDDAPFLINDNLTVDNAVTIFGRGRVINAPPVADRFAEMTTADLLAIRFVYTADINEPAIPRELFQDIEKEISRRGGGLIKLNFETTATATADGDAESRQNRATKALTNQPFYCAGCGASIDSQNEFCTLDCKRNFQTGGVKK